MKVLSDILHKAGILKENAEAYSSGGYSVLVRNDATQRIETVPSASFTNIYTADGTIAANRVVNLNSKQLIFRDTNATLQNYTYSIGIPTGAPSVTWPSSVIFEGQYDMANVSPEPFNTRVWARNPTSSFRAFWVNQVYADVTGESTGATNIYNQWFITRRGSQLDTSTAASSFMIGLVSQVGHAYTTNQNSTTANIQTTQQEAIRGEILNYVGTIDNSTSIRSTAVVGYSSQPRNTTVTNHYGVKVDLSVGFNGAFTSLLTNYYGVFLSTPTVGAGGTITNRWGVYAPDSAMRHYLNGNVLIGTTTDAGYKLDVQGTGRFTGNVTIHSQANPELLIQPNVVTGSARLKIYNSGSSALGIHIATGVSDTGLPTQLRNMIGLISPYGYFISTNGAGAIGTSDIAIFAFNSKSVSFNSVTEYASAQVAIDSTTKGFLQPRMTTTQRDAIVSPATGLSVYNTTTNTSDFYNGTSWVSLAAGNIYTADGTLTGNRTVTSGGYNLTFTGSNTAASAIARGLNLTHTLVAAANNDTLVGLDINPTFTNGAFTGVRNLSARFKGQIQQQYFTNTNNQFLNLGSGWELFGLPHGSGGSDYYISPAGFQLSWNLCIGDNTSQHKFTASSFVTSDITANSIALGGVLSSYKSSPITGFTFLESLGWNFVIRNAEGNNRFRVFATTGNIGINTNSDAGYRFDVNGTGRFTDKLSVITTATNDVALFKSVEPYITIEASGASNSASIFLKPSTSAQNATIQNRSGGGLEFYTGATPSLAMTIGSNQGVGIGAAPSTNHGLQLSTVGKYAAFVNNLNGAATPVNPSNDYGLHLAWNYTGGSGESNIIWGTGIGSYPYLTFSTWNGTTKTDRVVFQNTGLVTLTGYTSVSSFTGTVVGHLAFDATGNIITVPIPSGGSGTPAGSSGQVQFNSSGSFGADSNFFWDNTNKRLGLGNASPTTRLDVTGAGTFSGNVTAAAFFESSDARIKENITEYNTDILSSIPAKIYKKNGRNEIGYIAQDVENVYSDAVHDHNGYKHLSYREIHTAKIASLEKEIRELKSIIYGYNLGGDSK